MSDDGSLTDPDPWPVSARLSAGDRSLLLAALAPTNDARSAWQAAPRASADRGRLLPLVSKNLAAVPSLRESAALDAAYRDCWLNTSAQLAALADAIRALHAAGLPCLVLKGAALSLLVYRDPGLRPMSDVDLLVPEASTEEAWRALVEAGWVARREPESWRAGRQHAATLGHPRGSVLDLHRHAIYRDHAPGIDAGFWRRAVPLRVGDQQAFALSPADLLLHVFVHGQRWTPRASAYWVADAILILRRCEALDWAALCEEAARRGRLPAVQQGMRTLERLLPGTIPATALPLLSRPSRVADRLEFRYASREPSGLLGSLPNEWFAYAREERARGRRVALHRFAAWLTQAWHVDRRGWRAVLRGKLRGRWTRRRRGDRAVPIPEAGR